MRDNMHYSRETPISKTLVFWTWPYEGLGLVDTQFFLCV